MSKKKIMVIMLVALVLIVCVIYLWDKYQKGANEAFRGVINLTRWFSDISVSGKSSKPSFPINESILKKKHLTNYIFVKYKDLNGLKTGDKVRYDGKLVGVADIYWINTSEERGYTILLKFNDRGLRIKNNSKFYINMLGRKKEKYIEILSDQNEEGYIKKGACIDGEDVIRLQN